MQGTRNSSESNEILLINYSGFRNGGGEVELGRSVQGVPIFSKSTEKLLVNYLRARDVGGGVGLGRSAPLVPIPRLDNDNKIFCQIKIRNKSQ